MKKQAPDQTLSDTWLTFMDQDMEWWPFKFLKPQPEEALSQHRVALLAILHALPITLLFAVVARLDGEPVDLLRFSALVCIGSHAALWVALAMPWNKRARRLNSGASPYDRSLGM